MKNKRLVSIIISACLLFGVFPAVSFADGWDGSAIAEPNTNGNGAYIITSAEELAWLAKEAKTYGSSANAILEADIDLSEQEWTPIGYSNYAAYSGKFDGNGHTVSGLKTTSVAYAGLFGYVSGKVSNLTVKGDLQYTGYSTPYAGGIAAYNTGTIENCVSETTISGKMTSGGIAGVNDGDGRITGCISKSTISGTSDDIGGIAGSVKGGVISLCANYGTVTSASYPYVGGIAGRIQGSAEIKNVYNMGDISGKYVGGIAGYVYSSLVSISSAYSAGTVTCTGSYGGGVAGQTGYGVSAEKITNCYFLKTDTINKDLFAIQKESNDRTEDLCGKAEEELKSADFIASLGGAFESDITENPINKGYPILKWQNPNASYKAVITVNPANASVSLTNSDGTELSGSFENGVYTFDKLSKGDYTYTVLRNEDDYAPESGKFTIANTDYYNTVTLLPNTYTVSFTVSPSHADFTLKLNDTVLSPAEYENGKYEYALPNGSYLYSASAFGYSEETANITVNKNVIEKSIVLDKLPNAKITFSLIDKTSGAALDNLRTEIKSGDYTAAKETDGSYLLPIGTYTYTVMCSGYAKCKGTFDVTQADIDTGAKAIPLETEPSDAWDGDMDEPEYSDGAWQISTGNELAWFAGYVNGTHTTELNGVSYNAILTADINLGGEISWTPIGKNYSEYSGTFDGNGHTVRDLYIDTNLTYQGVFGKSSQASVIKNLVVEGDVKSTSTESYAYIGGICGYNAGQILNCINKADVTGDGGCIGGICGYSSGTGSNAAIISQCANYGTISYESDTGQYKGGIAGRTQYTNISKCSNSGSISGNGNFIGGIAGDLASSSTLTDCYNIGAINSTAYSFGGIAGRTYLSSYGNYGLENCYNAGEVNALSSASQNYGALIGYYDSGNVTNCYCLIEESGVNAGLDAIGKVSYGETPAVDVKASADELRGILTALNTNNAWAQNETLNSGFPILLWQNTFAEYTVIFTVNPSTATLELSLNDTVIPPAKAENGIYEYHIADGSYRYTASQNGFFSQSDEITVNGADDNIKITLNKIPETTVKIDGELLTSDIAAIAAGHHQIEVDYSLIGSETEKGLLVLAIYSSGDMLEKIYLAEDAYTLSSEYDIPDGTIIKILFWDENLEPITDSVVIRTIGAPLS